MSRKQCEVCGETKFDNWPYCPACGHPYPEPDNDDTDDEEDDDDDGTLDD